MLFRFSLYGFLKNQRYFEPFIILAFRQKGLDFAAIGILIGFREICINLLEIPTGAIADALGRRHSMIASFLAYIISFFVFGISAQLWMLFPAMFFFSVGEAFRTGTHKAMIFAWLEFNNRQDKKTEVYGFTRSWSKIGSAVSVIIAAVLMFFSNDYSKIFLFSIVPAVLNILNFLSYPDYVDGETKGRSMADIGTILWNTLKTAVTHKAMRRLLIESANYEGLFKTSKEYVQPIIKTVALAMPLLLGLQEDKRTAIMIGLVYVILYLLSSYASRHANAVVTFFRSEAQASSFLWFFNLCIYGFMAVGVLLRFNVLLILTFILYNVAQNIWRPILVGRVANLAKSERTATVLSVESQTSSLFVAVCAPLLGWAVDVTAQINASLRFLPLALLGLSITVLMLLTKKPKIA
ncbi:MFS transporter [candidate division KSB1 bacterium]|nr:MFS transporter [candidate division KSB1 bacterium]RQW04422.1 MAG: MFS transporter [candidate division KSB1 bacterium]